MLQKPLDIADKLEYARLSRNQCINMGIVKRKLDFLQTYWPLKKGMRKKLGCFVWVRKGKLPNKKRFDAIN